MTDNLIQFYKDILNMVEVQVDDSGKLYVQSNKRGKLPIMIDGLPVYLPTKENIKTATEIDTNGKIVLKKYLFNPLQEDAIKGENKTFIKYKDIVERYLNNKFAITGIITWEMLSDKNGDLNSMKLLGLIDLINKYKANGIKQIVDETTVKNWLELYQSIMHKDTHNMYLHTYLKKGGKIKNVKYNRVGVLTFPVYEVLKDAKSKDQPFGLKLRNKDIQAYKNFYEFIFDSNEETLTSGIQLGNKNKVAPGFVALMQLYEIIKNANNSLLAEIQEEGFDEESIKDATINTLPFNIEDIEDIVDNLINEIREMPTESDLLIGASSVVEEQPTVTQVHNPQAIQQTELSSEEDALNAILGNNTNQQQQYDTYQQPQQPMMQQPTIPQQQNPWGQAQQPMIPQQQNPWGQAQQPMMPQQQSPWGQPQPMTPQYNPWGY